MMAVSGQSALLPLCHPVLTIRQKNGLVIVRSLTLPANLRIFSRDTAFADRIFLWHELCSAVATDSGSRRPSGEGHHRLHDTQAQRGDAGNAGSGQGLGEGVAV